MRRLVSLLLLVVPACSNAPSTTMLVTSDGVHVDGDGHGAVTLTLGGHALGGVARGPVARTFDETSPELLGGFTFRRVGEVQHVFDTFSGATATASGGVELAWGIAAEPAARATIDVGADAPDGTVVTLTVTGIANVGSIAFPFACDANATFYGFGEQYNAVEQRGEAFPLWVSEQGIGRTGGSPITGNAHTTYFPMPYWLDLRGFGVLARTDRRVLVDVCKTDRDVAWIEVEDSAPVELLVLHGPGPRDVIDQLGARLGRPTLPPTWAFDNVWIAAQTGHDAVLARAASLRANDIPSSVLWVQDWSGGHPAGLGGWDVQYRWIPDDTLYPDIAGMVTSLHSMGFKFLAYANPFVVDSEVHFTPMSTMGLLAMDSSGDPYVLPGFNGNFAFPDFTVPTTKPYIEGYLRAMVHDDGFDGWMGDFGEWLPLDAQLHDGSDIIRAHQRYPSDWHRLSREVMGTERPDGDWVVFTRSGWTGEQGVAQVVWMGDQQADWDTSDGLPTVIPAMLNLGLAGIPYVTHDIAGYSGGPSDQELYERWTELGAFTPVMRTHDGLNRTTNWSWDRDAATLAHFRRFARIHVALAPLFEQLAMEATTTSMPIVRPLALVAPDDPGSRGVSDELLIGDDLLVAPVLTPRTTSRDVYLPPGDWVHVWTGTHYSGGAHVTVDAPIGSPPVFSRGVDRPELRAIM